MSLPHEYILASQSPRRRALLEALGMRIEVFVPDVDEAAIRAASLRAFVMHAAAAKAGAVRAALPSADDPRPIIAADTIVVLDGRALGKPRDRDEARVMLRSLSERTHEVLTGLALGIGPEGVWVDADRSEVTFRPLDEQAIERYLQTGAADDKAGAYGVQEVGAEFIERVEGDLTNVIGLPLVCLRRAMREAVGDDQLVGRSLRRAMFRAYPEIEAMPPALWSGVPD
jgi:septum formation protein